MNLELCEACKGRGQTYDRYGDWKSCGECYGSGVLKVYGDSEREPFDSRRDAMERASEESLRRLERW